MSTERAQLLAEGARLERARTPGPWVLSTDWCDCGNGYGCSHGEFPFALTPHPRPEGWKPYDSLIDSFDKATVADGEFIAFCGTHMGTLLSLLASEGAKVKALEADLAVLRHYPDYLYTAKARAEKAEAEVTRLRAQQVQFRAWLDTAGMRRCDIGDVIGEVDRLGFASELEAQR